MSDEGQRASDAPGAKPAQDASESALMRLLGVTTAASLHNSWTLIDLCARLGREGLQPLSQQRKLLEVMRDHAARARATVVRRDQGYLDRFLEAVSALSDMLAAAEAQTPKTFGTARERARQILARLAPEPG